MLRILLLSTHLASLNPHELPPAERQMLDDSLGAHTAALASLSDFTCKYTMTIEPASPANATLRGIYWRRGLNWRVSQIDGLGRPQEWVHRDGVLTIRGKNDDGSPVGVITIPQSRSCVSEVALNHLLASPHRNGFGMPLSEISRGEVLKWNSVRRVNHKLGQVVELDANLNPNSRDGRPLRLIVRLSPAHNYLAISRSLIAGEGESTIQVDSWIEEFTTTQGGILLPAVAVSESRLNGKVSSRSRSQLSEVQVPGTFPDSQFTLEFEAGTRVTDQIRNELMVLGESGRVVSRRQLNARSVPLAASLPVTPPPPAPENWPWHWWLLATLPLAGLLWWFWRRRLAD